MGDSELLSILLVTTCLLRGLFTLVKVSSCPSDYFSAIKKGCSGVGWYPRIRC